MTSLVRLSVVWSVGWLVAMRDHAAAGVTDLYCLELWQVKVHRDLDHSVFVSLSGDLFLF